MFLFRKYDHGQTPSRVGNHCVFAFMQGRFVNWVIVLLAICRVCLQFRQLIPHMDFGISSSLTAAPRLSNLQAAWTIMMSCWTRNAEKPVDSRSVKPCSRMECPSNSRFPMCQTVPPWHVGHDTCGPPTATGLRQHTELDFGEWIQMRCSRPLGDM